MQRLGLFLFILPALAAAAADPGVLHKKVKSRMKSLDFDAALPLLEQLKGDPNLPAARRVEVLIDLGVTHVNLGQSEEAKRDFDDALGLDEAARPPSNASPKVHHLFEEAREARQLRLKPPPPEPKPAPRAPPEEVSLKPKPAPAAAAPAIVEAPPTQPWRPRMVALPVALAVAGAGAIAAGAIFAIQSQGLAREIQGGLHPSDEVMALDGRRSTFGTLTYAGYGVGAALLVAGAALFLFSGSF